jgi:hypothetical protein
MTQHRTHPPDLQKLVETHGGFDRIPPEAWEAFNRDMREWALDMMSGVYWQEEFRERREGANEG